MQIEVCSTAAAAAERAAELIAAELRTAVDKRGRGTVALSGGRTPAVMLQNLAAAQLPWSRIHIFQVDERIVAEDDDRRNIKAILASFERCAIPAENLHPMPVSHGLAEDGLTEYLNDLREAAGTPPCLDVVHLGLGNDGHTASLFAGDAAVVSDGEIELSEIYQGLHRMTLTLKTIDRARQRIWLVMGSSKRDIARRFLDADPKLVASQVRRKNSIIVLDYDAAGAQS